MTVSLHAITIVVPDYEAGLDFYVGKLGFELLQDDDLGNGKRWVMVQPGDGGCRILLAKAVNAKQRASIGNQTGGRVGFFLHTDDFHADYERFKILGVTFRETPRTEPYGTVVVFEDPFGNGWDLLQLNEAAP